MANPRNHLTWCLLLVIASAAVTGPLPTKGKPAPEGKPERQVDCCGDALPDQAIARLGTVRFREPYGACHVAFSPDGALLASDNGSHIFLWDSTTGRIVRTFPGASGTPVTSLAFSPDGKTLAATYARGANQVVFWEVRTGQQLLALGGHGPTRMNHVAFAADGVRLAAGDDKGVVWLWDLGQEKTPPQLLRGHGKAVHAVAFVRDGKTVASAGADGTVRLWDVATGKERLRFQGHKQAVFAVACAPAEDLVASAGADS